MAENEKRPFVIGVAGGTASGKTSLVDVLQELFGKRGVKLRSDNYYRDHPGMRPEDLSRLNYDHPDALEFDLMVQHLRQLKGGQAVVVPEYDFARHCRKPETEWQTLQPAPIVFVEGIMIFYPEELRNEIDLRLFVRTDDDVRLIRRLRRDTAPVNQGGRGRTTESVLDQWERTVRPGHIAFCEPTMRHARLVILEGGRDTMVQTLLQGGIVRLVEQYNGG